MTALAYETNCAGHGCEEAERCRRFRMRMPVPADPRPEHPVFEWASLDLERALFGDCLNFIRYHERRA